MPRNWHYLRASKSAGWPRQQCVLSLALGESTLLDRGCPVRVSRLLAWGAVTWSGQEGAVTREHVAGGTTVVEWWVYLALIMRRRERLWVWCDGMAHALSVLGFWGLIDNGTWAFCGGASRHDDGGMGCRGNGRSCPLVVGDTPTIVDARLLGASGSVRFVDTRQCTGVHSARCSGVSGEADSLGDGGFGSVRGAAEYAQACALEAQRQLIAYQRLVAELRLGGLRATAAAQAWHGWRHSYLDTIVEVHNDVPRLIAERQATYGGRVQVHRAGLVQGPVYEIDAQAHYPAIGAECALPARVARGVGGDTWCLARAVQSGYLCIARGRVHTDVPCLPHHYRGETVYPVGTWVGTYCYPEIELLRSEGGRFESKEWWVYEPAYCCQTVMRALWGARLRLATAANHGGVAACKAVSNSLIGRIGSTGRTWQDVSGEWFPDRWAQWYARDSESGMMSRWRTIAGRVQVERITGWGDESIPAISAWVYSLGRVRLWRWMRLIGEENLYYCDTDSLWTTPEGERIIREAGELRPGALGGLRVKAVHPWARFYGIRHYETPLGVKWAGVPENLVSASADGWSYTYGESPGESARHWRQPDGRLVTVDMPDRRTATGGRVGTDGSVYPKEVYDHESG